MTCLGIARWLISFNMFWDNLCFLIIEYFYISAYYSVCHILVQTCHVLSRNIWYVYFLNILYPKNMLVNIIWLSKFLALRILDEA